MPDRRTLLFSTFEPSGDALAAPLIASLLRQRSDLKIHALGGDKMRAAGANLIEATAHRGSMFLDTLAQVRSHRARLRRLRSWLRTNPIDALVPVDSPAGNWSICALVRRLQPRARIVHLVAPQLWAWAPWRVRRLRRLTDSVLCLLPFEPDWFARRGVKAQFVGHPAFEPTPVQAGTAAATDLPPDPPRLALLPGSRTGEIKRNWPTMLEAFVRLRSIHEDLSGVVAVADERSAQLLRSVTARHKRVPHSPQGLMVVEGQTNVVLDWCDLALAASGTICLQLTARHKPMVAMYNMNWLTIFAMGWMVRTSTFTLPNLVSQWSGHGRAVPELVPHFGAVTPVVRQLLPLMDNGPDAELQRQALGRIVACFATQRFSQIAPKRLIEVALEG